ncbi:hypothetical protein JCM10207_007364 [Rhodosporidiobolus poonsookiae]
MPLLRSPWSDPSAGSASSSDAASSTRSSLSALSASSHRSPPPLSISGPMPKRPQLVDVQGGRPVSQSASLLLAGGGGPGQARTAQRASHAGRTSGRSSRRASATADGAGGPAELADGPLQRLIKGRQPTVVVTGPHVEAPALIGYEPVKMEPESRASSLTGRKKRFSLFTLQQVEELERAEDGAVLLWMDKLTVTPHDSLDSLPCIPEDLEGTPSLSASSTAASSPASFRMLGTPSPQRRPFTPPTSYSGTSPSVTPKPSRTRLFSPNSSPKSNRTRSSSQSSPRFTTSRLLHPSRWGKQSKAPPDLEPPSEHPAEKDVFGPTTFSTPFSLPPQPVAGLGMSLSDPTLAPPLPLDTDRTPRRASAVRFASSSDPPRQPFPSSSVSSTSSAPARPTQRDSLEWEFVSPSVPSFDQGQRYAPPIEPRGRMRRLLDPRPQVRARKSYGNVRSGPTPTPSVEQRERARERSRASLREGGEGGRGEEVRTREPRESFPPSMGADGSAEPVGGDVACCSAGMKGKGREVVA